MLFDSGMVVLGFEVRPAKTKQAASMNAIPFFILLIVRYPLYRDPNNLISKVFFFMRLCLYNSNTVEFLRIWEQVNNPNFNYGEFTLI